MDAYREIGGKEPIIITSCALYCCVVQRMPDVLQSSLPAVSAGFLLALLFHPEDGSNIVAWILVTRQVISGFYI
jgi:hypothetical protein